MDILIQKLNGETKKFSDLGWIVKDILVSSAEIRTYKTDVQGKPGSIDKGADYGERTITVPFAWEAYDLMDYPFKRDEMYYWLGGIESFYIYEGRSLGKGYEFVDPAEKGEPWSEDNDIIYGKRYLVRRTGGFSPEQSSTWGETQIEFELVGLPFGQSTATTLVPFVVGTSGNAIQDSIWTLGHAKIFTDPTPQYIFNGSGEYRVYNGGTETVDPEEDMYLVITHKGVSSNLSLTNSTNGSRWRYNGTSNASQNIVINGIDATKGVQSIVGDTTLDLIKLSPGWNTIAVTGATGELSFDFRWYFR